MSIEVKNITKRFGTFTALKEVSLEIPTGELVALLGPSGSGKTTLLRIIAGLEIPDSGSIHFQGEDATDRSARDRRVGFVFQHYALFRHMTVFENIAFGLRVKPRDTRLSETEIEEKVHSLLKLVQLDWLANHYPSQLSGGQRQRVALARALAVEPKVLLLDEPFGALDAKVRLELRRWLRRLHDEIHVTSVFVTHDQEEALEVADRVVVMNEGQIVQIGTPEEIYNRPANTFVHNFLGNLNIFRGRVIDDKAYIGNLSIDLPEKDQSDAKTAVIYIRPHQLDISLIPVTDNHFHGKINHINPVGPLVRVELISDWGDSFHAEISQERYKNLGLKKGDHVFVTLRDQKVFIELAKEDKK